MPDEDYSLTPEQVLISQAAYARYCAVVGRTWDDRPLPTWIAMSDKIRKGWYQAGNVPAE